jgi:cyclomaltodextrinase / maltogenic alpha-amylase / neopullulanase
MMTKAQHLKQQTIYQVFVRNHTQEGTFQALIKDLPRIQKLGVKWLYLLPIHPIGKLARKGNVGSPYAIQDYYQIDSSLGTSDDLKALIQEAHRLGMNMMMDIVFNHTAKDALWVSQHPEYYYYKDGKLANRIGDWSDIADLDLTRPDVRKALIDVLVFWTKFGFDGYRCDVAPLLPIDFWREAKIAVNAINSNTVWLSESVHPHFIQHLRGRGFSAHSDAEMYQVFDMLYDYDVHEFLTQFLTGKGELSTYLRMVQAQSYIYPADYVKAHFLENHDVQRIHQLVSNPIILRNLTAWSFFQPGIGFIYAGQEMLATKLPHLFEKDPIELTIKDPDFYALITRLIAIKSTPYFASARQFIINEHPLQSHMIEATLSTPENQLVGYFNLTKDQRKVYTTIRDGTYLDLISQQNITIRQGILTLVEPLILVVS